MREGVIHEEKIRRKPHLGWERKLLVVRIFGNAIAGYDFFFLPSACALEHQEDRALFPVSKTGYSEGWLDKKKKKILRRSMFQTVYLKIKDK